jgi:hypothetical protein
MTALAPLLLYNFMPVRVLMALLEALLKGPACSRDNARCTRWR